MRAHTMGRPEDSPAYHLTANHHLYEAECLLGTMKSSETASVELRNTWLAYANTHVAIAQGLLAAAASEVPDVNTQLRLANNSLQHDK